MVWTFPRCNVGTDPASLGQIRRWSRAGEHAPHKPLLVLYAIARTLDGSERLEDPLRILLQQFGPPSRQRVHPEYPFWRLQHDGFWEVVDASSFAPRMSNTDPPISELRRRDARAGFITIVDSDLRTHPDGARDCAAGLALRFFPGRETRVLDAVGLRR